MQEKQILEEFLKAGAICSTPNGTLLVGYGPSQELGMPPKNSHPHFYFPDFFLAAPKPWILYDHYLELSLEALLKLLANINIPQTKSEIAWKNPNANTFAQAFLDLQRPFQLGELQKAVPYVFEISNHAMCQTRLVTALSRLLQVTRNKPLHIYGCWNDSGGILGATPEILFRMANEGKLLETMACAGTAPSGDAAKTLLQDAKILHEHQLVVAGIADTLKSLGQVSVKDMQILQLPHLAHLATPIECLLSQQTPFETIVRAMHPTPALGTFPKEKGQTWLRNYQTMIPRFRFGAPCGYVWKDHANCLVGIRNMQWMKEGLMVGAGCGIVKGSILEQEWREIQLKISSIKDMLGL